MQSTISIIESKIPFENHSKSKTGIGMILLQKLKEIGLNSTSHG
jgi:hypothetical protein